jgi:predicted ATPase/DNA-binding winged helix-turn-helix (wHTH) protein
MADVLTYHFGAFRLVPALRTLFEAERPLKVGARALDLLQVLVERRDRVVGKDEMLDIVWLGLVVEENNLQVHVAALRKLLGHPAITTVPGRGYRFTMPVRVEGDGAPPVPPPPAPARAQAPDLIGREHDLPELLQAITQQPLVTLTGAGGIGKTRLARAAADRLAADGRTVCWVDLAPLSDPALIARTVARAVGLSVDGADDDVRAAVDALNERQPLLVLDNAEHLLDGVAAFVAALRARAPALRVLVTSQEVLRIDGEQVLRAQPLSLPATDGLAAAAASGAVALFAARAAAADPRFRLDVHNVAGVVEVCRRLDGIPLAIVLAAGRVALLGVDGVRARLDERFQVLTAGARVSLRRHQTLRAALEWSYGLLDTQEQAVFRRLGSFVGSFTLEAVQSVCADDRIDPWDVLEHLGSLVDKSVVQAEGGQTPRYRLLDTTRLFAVEQLANAGETDVVLHRHAQATAEQLAARGAWPGRWLSTAAQFQADVAEVDNARAALGWAAARGDHALAVEVAACTARAFQRADLVNEFGARARPLRTRLAPTMQPTLTASFWLRLASAGTKSTDADAQDAARRAVDAWRRLGDAPLLYEALACAVLIGACRADAPPLAPLIAEMLALEQADWPPAALSFGRWAEYRALRRAGDESGALRMAQDQVVLSSQRDPVFTLRIEGVNVVDCEIALGRPAEAEQRARRVLAQLAEAGLDDGRTGPVLEGLALALVQQGRFDEALPVARRARLGLLADGDDLRLLEPLAWAAAQGGRAGDAARVMGHVDAAHGWLGLLRWPAAAARRAALEASLLERLGPQECARQCRLGQSLSRDAAHALALGDG